MSLFPDLPPEDWLALYAAGSSLVQIADRTGYPATRVRQELLVRGVVLRRPGVRLGSRQRISGWHATAAMMRAQGYCYAAIARELGQSPAAVRGALVRQAPDQPPPATPKLSAKERRLRHADRLATIRLRMAIGRELDERGITTPTAIGEALGMPATEATKLLRGHQWREGDVARLEAAATRLGVQVSGP